MGFFKSKAGKDINYFELTPSAVHKHRENGDGLVDILVPRFTNKIMAKLTKNMKNPYIRANLDKFGSATWRLIDGQNKVKDIADGLIEQFGEEIQPIEQRLTDFLTQLYRAGFISFNELKGK